VTIVGQNYLLRQHLKIYYKFDCNPVIRRLKKRYEECSTEQRKIILKKIMEIVDPNTIWLNESFASNCFKGAASKNDKKTNDHST